MPQADAPDTVLSQFNPHAMACTCLSSCSPRFGGMLAHPVCWLCHGLQDCNLFVMDHCASVTIDDCSNCRIFIGPTEARCALPAQPAAVSHSLAAGFVRRASGQATGQCLEHCCKACSCRLKSTGRLPHDCPLQLDQLAVKPQTSRPWL